MPKHDDVIEYDSNQRKTHVKRFAPRDQEAPGLVGWRGDSLKDKATPRTVMSMQRLAGNAAVVQMLSEADEETESVNGQEVHSPVLDVVGRGGGSPLDEGTRTSMERTLGADLSQVRIHDDDEASASAEAVNAKAYTVGNDVVFQSGLYDPQSDDGRRMLAHELTHVVQQRTGPVDGTPTEDGISISDPSDRFEQAAEATAERAVGSREGVLVGASAGAGVSQATVAQREADDADEEEADYEAGAEAAEEEFVENTEEQLEEGESS